MSAPARFTPLWLATFIVAALWLPIVLFPYGGALLMNIVFFYGLRDYRANKGHDIFKAFTWITGLTCGLVALIGLIVPFETIYSFIREAALIGPILREELPSGQDLILFQVVVFASLLCANPYITYGFARCMDTLDAPVPRDMLPRLRRRADGIAVLPLLAIVMIILQIIYLAGLLEVGDARGRLLDHLFTKMVGREYTFFAPLLVINLSFLFALTIGAYLYTLARSISKKI